VAARRDFVRIRRRRHNFIGIAESLHCANRGEGSPSSSSATPFTV
jgi:hypothetical protein